MMTLAIAIPLIAAFLAAIRKSWGYILYAIAAILNFILSLSLIGAVPSIHALGGWKPPFGINLVLDNASFYAILFINAIFLIVAVFPDIIGKYATVMLVLMAAVNGFVLTGDLFNSFVFMEIISAAAVIIASKRENYYSAFKYLIFAGIAGSLYLIAVIFVYTQTGSLNMAQAAYFSFSQKSLVAITTLFLIGLGVEAKLFPLNGWVMGVYGGNDLAPVILSTAVTFSAMYMMGRLMITIFGGGVLQVLYVLALITMLAGELAALYQKNLLKTLAYSSIGQAGLVLAVLSKGKEPFTSLAYFQLMNEVTAKLVLFLVAGYLVYKYTNLNGIFKSHKVLGTAFSIASFSLVGFPLFAGFQSKLRIIMEAFKGGDYLLPALLLLATLIELTYLIRWNVRLWFEDQVEEGEKGSWRHGFVAIALAIFLVVIFFFPNIYLAPASKMADAITSVSGYINIVTSGLGGM